MKTNSISLQWNPIEILSILHDVTIFIIIIKKISKECCTSIPKILHPLPKYTSSSDIQKDGSRSRFARIRLARLNLGRENQPRPWPNRRRGHPYDPPPPPPLLLVSVGVSDEPGPLSWTQQATRPEREANKHRRYITRRPQIPSGPLNGPNEKQRDNGRPGLVQRERVKEREREKERKRGEGWLFSRVFEHPERTRATVSKGPWKRRRGTNWYLWEFYATTSLSSPFTIASLKFSSTRFRDIWCIWKVSIS